MYINTFMFSAKEEISSLEVLKEEISSNYYKYNLFNSKIDQMFELTKSYIDKAWIKIINNTILLLKKVKKLANKIIIHLNPSIKFKPFNASFSNCIINHLIDFKREMITFNNISELYYAYIESIHFNIINIKRAYKQQIDLLNSYYNDLYNNIQKKAVNESNYDIRDFTPADSGIFTNDDYTMLGEELLNQFAIENIRVFDNIDINDIFICQELNIKKFNVFKERIIQNIAELINPSSEYRKIEDKLNKSDLTTNIMLESFYKKIKSRSFNRKYIEFELKNALDIYLATDNFINDKANLKALERILTLIMLKSNTVIEAMNNIIRLDAYVVYKVEYDSIESVNDIHIESIMKVQNIIDKNKSKIFKYNNRFIDFTDYKLGQIYLSKSAVDDVFEKYVNLKYNTTLLYLISNYDITIISHGLVIPYRDFGHFYSHNKNNKYLLECYKEEFEFCANLVNKDDIMNLSFEDCVYIENVLQNDNELRKLVKKFQLYLQLKEFANMYYRRWECDKVYIPFIDKELTDVESIIYILNKNKFKRILLLICNYNIMPTSKPISFYDKSTVTISPIEILR